jgi:hypothetical protein
MISSIVFTIVFMVPIFVAYFGAGIIIADGLLR